MFFTLSTINFVLFFSFISLDILLYPCITVEWSLFPKSAPICGKDIPAISLHRYIAICLGNAISFDLLLPAKSSLSMLKYLLTVSFIKSQDITFSFSYLNSFIIFIKSGLYASITFAEICNFSWSLLIILYSGVVFNYSSSFSYVIYVGSSKTSSSTSNIAA